MMTLIVKYRAISLTLTPGIYGKYFFAYTFFVHGSKLLANSIISLKDWHMVLSQRISYSLLMRALVLKRQGIILRMMKPEPYLFQGHVQ